MAISVVVFLISSPGQPHHLNTLTTTITTKSVTFMSSFNEYFYPVDIQSEGKATPSFLLIDWYAFPLSSLSLSSLCIFIDNQRESLIWMIALSYLKAFLLFLWDNSSCFLSLKFIHQMHTTHSLTLLLSIHLTPFLCNSLIMFEKWRWAKKPLQNPLPISLSLYLLLYSSNRYCAWVEWTQVLSHLLSLSLTHFETHTRGKKYWLIPKEQTVPDFVYSVYTPRVQEVWKEISFNKHLLLPPNQNCSSMQEKRFVGLEHARQLQSQRSPAFPLSLSLSFSSFNCPLCVSPVMREREPPSCLATLGHWTKVIQEGSYLDWWKDGEGENVLKEKVIRMPSDLLNRLHEPLETLLLLSGQTST
jgi:hypothetical protein